MRHLHPAGRALRGVSLLALGALAVHQATYALAGGADLQAVSASQRHGYLAELAPALAWASLAAIALSLVGAAVTPVEATGRFRRARGSDEVADDRSGGRSTGVFRGAARPGEPAGCRKDA